MVLTCPHCGHNHTEYLLDPYPSWGNNLKYTGPYGWYHICNEMPVWLQVEVKQSVVGLEWKTILLSSHTVVGGQYPDKHYAVPQTAVVK